ncbi:sulfatase family protein [Leptospira kmetyi]|uniref:sulfatase family protein n=1 Tax=Leptospira kmetyi TaxID=408139 RepID=UPI00039062FD|nr:type I phosphodiesterase/nucleotide pyrophosphatase [Leptospira kmetyi serovar Malaysia str. Bejo-Iso9]
MLGPNELFKSIPKRIRTIFAEKRVRVYLVFFGIGMGISFVTLILNSSFQIMGVDLSEFKSLFLSFLPLFLKDYIQTLLSSGILFGAIGLLLSYGFANGKEKSELETTKEEDAGFSLRKEFWIFGVFVFLLWCHSIVFYPQLYGEFFFYRFAFLRFFLFFLTDWIFPWIPQTIALGILGFCAVRHSVVLIREKNWNRLVVFVAFCVFLFIFHRFGSVLGVFIATILYLSNGIFKNSKHQVASGVVVVLSAAVLFWNGKAEKKSIVAPFSETLPNILILSADSLRYDKMGYVLGKKGMSPHIDSLSADSVIFQDHHTTIPRTFPAWADLLTGRPSFVHGIQDMFPDAKDRSGLNENSSRTIPYFLSELGYRTNVVSSFAGDIFPRADWGFQTVKAPIFHAGTLTAQRILESQILLLPIVTGSIPGAGEYFKSLRGLPSLGDDSRILPDLFETLRKEKNPFFTVFFSSVTHFPFSPPYPYYKNFTNSEYYGKFKYFKFVDPSDSSELSAADREQIRGLFQAGIASFDDAVGEIVARLKEEGLYDSTLIVLTSDHGESLFEADHSHGHGEHLRGEGVTHIPLLIKFPKNAGAGKKFSGISSSLDLFPTLLETVLADVSHSPLKEKLSEEVKNRPGRNLSFALESATWKDLRNVYGETGIWFSDRGDHFFQKERIFYPNILRLHSIETGDLPLISIADPYAKESVIVSKHRMFQNANRKLLYIPSENGVIWRCYDRIADPWNEHPLPIGLCSSLKDSLVSFLISSGKFKKAGEYLLPSSN